MECDQCGARRPRTGPCPTCGAPPPGTYSSLRQWRNPPARTDGASPRRGSGARWGAGSSGRFPRDAGDDWAADDEAWDENPAPRGRRQGAANYEDVDLERALVPAHNEVGVAGAGGPPALPGMPLTDEEERALGIRRPVYIPATGEGHHTKPSTWRVVSGLLSIVLVMVAACGLAGIVGRPALERLLPSPLKTSLTPPAYNFSTVPATPVATPGPAHTYVQSVVTAHGVDSNYNPLNVATHFTENSTVYVVLTVRGIPKGQQHMLSVRWYLQGLDLNVQAISGAQTTWTLTSDSNAYFGLNYPAAGIGMARIYWDRPASDTSESPTDPHLAQTIIFAIEPPAPVPSATTKTGVKTPVATTSPATKTAGH